MWNTILVLFGLRTDMAKIVGKFEKAMTKLDQHTAQASSDANKARAKAAVLEANAAAAANESVRAKNIAANFKKLLAA